MAAMYGGPPLREYRCPFASVHFAAASVEIDEETSIELERAIQRAARDYYDIRFEVVAHSDPSSPNLARRRMEAVGRELVDRGVPATMISTSEAPTGPSDVVDVVSIIGES
jgi:outer membrane protein OmpA-like peptidoglycan-associated protein